MKKCSHEQTSSKVGTVKVKVSWCKDPDLHREKLPGCVKEVSGVCPKVYVKVEECVWKVSGYYYLEGLGQFLDGVLILSDH